MQFISTKVNAKSAFFKRTYINIKKIVLFMVYLPRKSTLDIQTTSLSLYCNMKNLDISKVNIMLIIKIFFHVIIFFIFKVDFHARITLMLGAISDHRRFMETMYGWFVSLLGTRNNSPRFSQIRDPKAWHSSDEWNFLYTLKFIRKRSDGLYYSWLILNVATSRVL